MENTGFPRRALIFVGVFFLFLIGLSGQTPETSYQVKGIAMDSVSGESVSYATITIQSNQRGIVKRLAADSSGNFRFNQDTIGQYSIVFQSIGYKSKIISLNIDGKTSKIDLGKILITPGVEKIGEVAVIAEKPLIKTEADKIVYSFESDPESKTNTVLEMLRKVPLVSVDGEDNVQLKGSSNFKFLLNGKSSSMLSQNSKDVLRSMPASTVRDIEVITNPSSKYEAEGIGGIINIITAKKQLDGFMGRVNTGASSFGGFNGGLYASSKIKKFGFSVTYNTNAFRQPGVENYSSRENLLSSTNRFTESVGNSKYKGLYNFTNGEASYEVDTFNLVSLSFFGAKGGYRNSNEMMTDEYDINYMPARSFANEMNMKFRVFYLSGNIDYQRTFKKPDKTFTVSYKLDHTPTRNNYKNDVTGLLNYDSYRQKSINDATGTEHTFQIDYYDPLTKMHQVETGFKYILRRNVSNSDIFWYDDSLGDWKRDETRMNDLDYNQHIFGIYAGYVMKLKKFSIKTGLRAEGTINDGVFKSVTNTAFTNKMFNMIPYILLSQNLDKGQSLKLSYTQRLRRPSIWYLNPYVNDTDPLNIQYGNPHLDAEVSHTFEFSYGKFTPQYNFNISLSSAYTNNSIESVSTMQSDGVRVTTYENIGRNQRYGSNIYGSAKIGKKMNLNTNLGLYYNFIESNDSRSLSNKGFNYNGSMNARYNAWKNGTLSYYAGIYSPRVMLQGKTSLYSYNSLSLMQEMLNKKLTASLSVNMPFRKNLKFETRLNDPTFRQTTTIYYLVRQVRLNISYRFGQMKGEIKKARRGIKNEDLKSGGEPASTGPTGTGN